MAAPVRRESEPNSSIGGVGDVGMFGSCVLFGGAQLAIRVQLTFGLIGRPSEFLGEQRRDRWGGSEAGRTVEQMSAGAAGKDVVECRGHLVVSGVDGFGSQVGLAGDQRFTEIGAEGDKCSNLDGQSAVPMGAGGGRRCPARPSSPVDGRPSSLRRRVADRRVRNGVPSRLATRSTVSSAISRYVVSLPPLTRTTPASLTATWCWRDRSAVLELVPSLVVAVFTSGRSPAHTPVMSSGVTRSVIVGSSAWLSAVSM